MSGCVAPWKMWGYGYDFSYDRPFQKLNHSKPELLKVRISNDIWISKFGFRISSSACILPFQGFEGSEYLSTNVAWRPFDVNIQLLNDAMNGASVVHVVSENVNKHWATC